MKTEIFTFDMPENIIANEPANPRDSSKLLHILPNGELKNYTVADLDKLLRPDDVLIFNNTKVIPARLYGKRGEAKIEVTLFKQIDLSKWETLIKNSRRLKINDTIQFTDTFSAVVEEKKENGSVILAFDKKGADLMSELHQVGTMPLPPYIKRNRGGKESDKANYQTIYAKKEGAVAAPTAGLHFTPELFERLDKKGVERLFVTLHVGGGTFLPVKVEDTDNHKMHAEFGILTQETADKINLAKKHGRRIVTIGTTSLRLLESATDENGIVHAFSGETDIFITPGYRFKATDVMFTNFHLSGSTLFMLVSAFAGIDRMKQAYAYAIQNNYRFFSYGDACLIEVKQQQ
ncbi:MAG: tRNA preQ1(34) S-adenosylmethionine ribosyltransferase-isomerase QueA [Alphaproteobacteria bacterium]|nr:tRNA preQ1(34) S-adenosylmethionine ribosyltransferase-isomerase QueA [Alphaproteobacteria bacterium]